MLEGDSETMSNRIDQRIVEMSFENHKFEKGIHQSKNSLKDFSDALKNMGNGKDFSGLENSVQSVSSSFSMLEQVGIGALRRIGEAAVNAGGSLVKSLTVDQLASGLNKYQEKIEAVQTMVSAGYGLEEVEKSMAQLMWFSDETSYSFADMAGNMAKFISAGVGLKTSEKAMQGIATWAAHSGKNSQAASIAMFNLSQAISMGYVDTMNWRSIMNQNMNTTMFKEIAIGVAEATGAIKKGEVTIQNFDSNLKDKWFTNEVLLKTLEQYSSYAEKVKEVQDEMGFDTAKQAMDYMESNADKYSDVMNQIGNAAFKASQESKSFKDSINATMDAVSSGWLKTYEIIFGTLYEAKANFGALTEILWTVFAASAESRNEMLQAIKDAGGIKSIFQSIKNLAVALLKPLKAISQAFDQFFPPRTETQWLGIINTLEIISKKLIITDETANKIQRTFAGLFAIIDIGWQTVKFLGAALYEVIGIFIPLNGNLLNMTASIGDFLVVLNHLIKQSGVFQYGLLGFKVAAIVIRNLLTNIIGKISEFVRILWTTDKPLEFIASTVKNIFSGIIDTIKNGITWISSKFMGALSGVQKFLNTKMNIDGEGTIGGVLNTLREFISFIVNEATSGLGGFGDALRNLDFNKIATFVTGGILLLFINQLSHLTRSMADLVTTTNSFVSKLSKKLFATQNKIKDLAYVFGILSASLFVLSKIPWKEMKVGLTGLAGAIGLFVLAYGSIQAITVATSKALNGVAVVKSTFSLVTLATGIAIMGVALKKISKVDEKQVWNSVKVIGAMMALLSAYQALSALISIIPGQNAVSISFSGMTFGVLGLIGIVALLDFISPESLKRGLGKLAIVVLVITGIQALFSLASRISGGNKLSLNLLGITGGLLGLLAIMKILSSINTRDVSQGIGNVLILGGVLAAIQLMFNLAGRVGGGIKFKTNIFSMQMGLLSMVALIAILGSIDDQGKVQNGIKNIAKMAGIIGALEVLTGIAARVGGGNKLQRILGSVSLTMLSFTALIGILGLYEQDTINQGLITIAKMLSIITAFQTLMAFTSKINTSSSGIGIIVGMVAGILTVSASLILLSMQDQTALKNAAVSLGVAVTTVGIMSAGFGYMIEALSGLASSTGGFQTIVSKLIPGFAAMGVVMLATLALIELIRFSNVDTISWSGFGKFTLGLVALTAMVSAFSLLTTIPGLIGGGAGLLALIPGFAGMTAVVIATAGLFAVMNLVVPIMDRIGFDAMAKFALGITLIGALATGITLLSPLLIAMGTGFLPALGGAVVAVAGVGLLIGTFVGLSALLEKLFGSDPDFLIRGIEKLILVGEGLGRFVGSIVGGFSSELIIGYGKGLAGFADAVKGIDSSSFAGVESLAKALLALTGAALLDGISRFLNFGKNPGKVFGEQLKGLMKAFSTISIEDAKNTADVLAVLGPVAENLKTLANAAKSIPNSGGLMGALLGNNDADDFGLQLKGFVNSFSEIILEDVNHSAGILGAMTPMATHLKTFAKAADKIPNSGGFLGTFLGNNDIDTFGRMLSSFVWSLKVLDAQSDVAKASEALSAMQPMVANLNSFAKVAQDLPNTGGVVSWFAGNNDINTFGVKLAEFVVSFSGLDVTKVETASGTLQTMTNDMLPGLERFATLARNLGTSGEGWQPALLISFASTLKEFIKTLKGVDVSVVGPALKSMSDINESFKALGSKSIDSAIRSFENNKKPFQFAISNLLDETIKIVDSKRSTITISLSNLLSEALRQAKTYIGDFKTLGSDIVNGLKNGIEEGQRSAVEAITTMTNNVTKASRSGFQVNSPSKVFEDIGGWLGIGLGNGIKRNTNVAILASTSMADGVEHAVRDVLDVHSESKKFNNIGEWLPKSIGSGIQNGKDTLLTIAGDLGVDVGDLTIDGITKSLGGGEGAVTTGINNLLKLLTGQKTVSAIADELGLKTGGAFTDSYTKGLDANKVKSKNAKIAKDAFQIFKESIDYRKEYNLISLEQELAEWQNFAKKYGLGTEIRMKADKEVTRVRAELDRKSFEHSKSWIENEKYYKRLSLLDELAAWERVQNRYAKGHEYRMQAERELFRLKQEIRQAEYQNSLDWIEEEKYYGRLNLTGELKAWTRIQSRYEKGSEERKKANREVFRLENEIREATLDHEEKIQRIETERNEKRKQLEDDYYNKTKEINDKLSRDIQSLNDEYENAVKSRAQSLYSTWGIFDKVDPFQSINGDELFKNLEDQVVAFDQWQAQIGILTAKGIDEGLVEELRSMGPKSLPQILALNKMTDSSLNGYVSLWQKKTREAKDQATFELQGMKEETAIKIQELTKEASDELVYYEKVWKDSLRQVNIDADSQLDTLEANWKKTMGDMTKDGIKTVDQFKTDLSGKMTEIIGDTDVKMDELEKNNQTTLQGINTDTTQQLTTLKQNWNQSIDGMTKDGMRYIRQFRSDWSNEISGMVSNTRSQMSELTRLVNSMDSIGRNVSNSLADSINRNSNVVRRAGQGIGSSVLHGANEILMIHSPSRRFMEIGKYSVEGFAEGLRRFSGLVYSEGTSIGKTALEAVSLSMNSIPELLENDVDEFSITPVLDLSNIRSGMSNINSLFNSASGFGLDANMDLLPMVDMVNQNGILAQIKDSLMSVTNQEVDLTGTLTVQVVNDRGEIVDIAETAIKDILRRESR